jgi:AP-5 complex subunit beta-1
LPTKITLYFRGPADENSLAHENLGVSCSVSFVPDHPLCDHLVTVVSAFASGLTVPISRDHEDLHLVASSTCSSSPPTAPTACPTTPRVRALDACAPSTPRYQVSLPRSSGTSKRSPTRQSYLLLLASAARHAMHLGRLASSASIPAVAGPPIPFIIPSHLLLSPAAPGTTIETSGT